MRKKAEDILLKLNKNLYKKKYLKIEPNKKQVINFSSRYNLNKEKQKENEKENYNTFNISEKKIYFNEKEIEDITNNQKNNLNKIVNGSPNNQISNFGYNKVSKTINNQKRNRNFIKENYRNRNDFLNNYKDINENYRISGYFEPNNLNNNKKDFISLNKDIIFKNEEDNFSFFGKNIELNNDKYEEKFKTNGIQEIIISKNNLKYDNNNKNNSFLNSSSASPKLYFDYKRISNLLINNSTIENKTINNNLFRKKKIKIKVNNTNTNIYTPIGYKQNNNEQKILFKNSSFNMNQKLVNNDDNNDDIPINKYKKYEIKNNISSILLSNKNNSNIIERNYNFYFDPKISEYQNNNYNSYNISCKPASRTANMNFFIESQYSNNKSNNIPMKEHFIGNRNNKDINRIKYEHNLKSENKNYSAINVFKRKETKENNKIPIARHIKNIEIKRKIFRNKKSSFNCYINNRKSIQNKMKNNDLNDDIYNFTNINKKNNQSGNNLNEQNNQIISDYCSSYIENEKENKKKMFCFNNQANNYENNKINIQKNSLIPNFEENKSNIIDDNKIIYIINKYKNNSIPNSRHLKNKKLKNLIFTYERIFKQQNSTFKPKINKNKFFNNDNKDDIAYKNNNSKKMKVKYLTPNTTKDKKSVNYILESGKNKILFNENYYGEKNNIKENNNIIIKRNTFTNDKNLKFDLNMTQSKSILNNIQYETNSNNCSKKFKDFLNNNLPEKRNEKKLNSKRKNNSISGKEKYKYKNIFGILKNNKKKEIINDYNNCETIDYNNNNSIKENSNSEDSSDSKKDIDMNGEYFKEMKKPIVINSHSCIYDNYGSKIFNDFKKEGLRSIEHVFNNNKNINNNYSKKNRNFIRYTKNQNQEYKKKQRICNCDKENYGNNQDLNIIDSDNLLLITNIAKCPICHCLFGKSSKILHNKK